MNQTVWLDILHFFIISVFIYGVVGNLLCYKIYTSSPLRKQSVSIFFRVIAIIDTIVLANALLKFIAFKYELAITELNVFFCMFKSYFFYSIGPIAPWLMVYVSIDRFVSITYPKRFEFIFKLPFQISILVFVCVFNFSFYSFMTWNIHFEGNFKCIIISQFFGFMV